MMSNCVGRTHRPNSVDAKVSMIGYLKWLTPAGCSRAVMQRAGPITHLGIIAGLAVALSGCVAPVTSHIAPDAGWAPESARVLLMPPDTRIHVITTGGLHEERADWTQESRANLTAALGEALSARSAEIVPYREFGETIPWDPDHAPMIRLYSVVGNAIRVADQLPTKRRLRETSGDLDYSLGDTVLALGESYSADYALLLHVNASYASTGRFILAVLGAAAAGGSAADTGSAVNAYSSLIDLRNGQVIWFGTIAPGTAFGDPREPGGARRLIDSVLQELPL